MTKSKGVAISRAVQATPELLDEICDRIAAGEFLMDICKDEHMPSRESVRRWVNKDHMGMWDMYHRAQFSRVFGWVDEIMEIADDSSGDWKVSPKGRKQIDKEAVQRSRVRIDTRKWLLAKLLPKQFGDKVIQEISGPGGGPIETTEANADETRRTIVGRISRIAARTAATGVLAEPNGNGTREP
jgi:hypothetical protein